MAKKRVRGVRVRSDETKLKNKTHMQQKYCEKHIYKGRGTALLKRYREARAKGLTDEATALLQQAAFTTNSARAFFLLARQLLSLPGADVALAFSYLRHAANLGLEEAHWSIAWGYFYLWHHEKSTGQEMAAGAATKQARVHFAESRKGCRCVTHGHCRCVYDNDKTLLQHLKLSMQLYQLETDVYISRGVELSQGVADRVENEYDAAFLVNSGTQGLVQRVLTPLKFPGLTTQPMALRCVRRPKEARNRFASHVYCVSLKDFDAPNTRRRYLRREGGGKLWSQPLFGRSYNRWAHWFQNDSDRKRVCDWLLKVRQRENATAELLQLKEERDEPKQPKGVEAYLQQHLQREAVEIAKGGMELNAARRLGLIYSSARESDHPSELPDHIYFRRNGRIYTEPDGCPPQGKSVDSQEEDKKEDLQQNAEVRKPPYVNQRHVSSSGDSFLLRS